MKKKVENKMNIGTKLKEYRLGHKVSALGMSKKTDITTMTISNIENNRVSPTWGNIEKICEYLGLHIVIQDEKGNVI